MGYLDGVVGSLPGTLWGNGVRAARLIAGFCCGLSALLLAASAQGQTTASDRAAAEALFDQAIKLMDGGNAAQGCPKLEESQRLDPGVGTLLYLADCYQQVGRTASAWATFREAAYAARAAGQSDRERIASEYAERLRPRLSYVTLNVAKKDTPGLEIKRDGQVIRKALWGTPVPVDPGPHRFEALATNKEPWQHEVTVPTESSQTEVDVPALSDAEVAATTEPATAADAPAPAASAEPAQSQSPVDAGVSGGSSQKTWGWVSAGVGAAGLVASGIFSLSALSENSAADDECLPSEPTRCNEVGLEKAQAASDRATMATITGGIGLVGVALGVILIATAPDEPRALRLSPSVARDGASISLTGAF